jgi:ribonuclease J
MKACIHRGSKEIGGTCIELESQGQRIILDIGCPLDCTVNEATIPEISGIHNHDKSLLGIIVSHPHLDHYGLLNAVTQDIPILIGDGAKKIINAANFFFPTNNPKLNDYIRLEDRKSITLGPFIITPYLVDHSAYDAYAIQIEADGKHLFYSGDFRGHGRKRKLFDSLLTHPPEKIDTLLMEGTTLSRDSAKIKFPSEDDLEHKFIHLIKGIKGIALIWCSAQNIDRLVTVYKACRKTNRLLIIDMYTASILKAIGNPNLPQPGWKYLKIFLPWHQKKIIKDRNLFDFAKTFSSHRIYPEQLEIVSKKAVMLFRPSMAKDLEKNSCLKNSSLIYSLWPGYLKEEKLNWFHDWLNKNRIQLQHCHTSGHAPIFDLQRFANSIKADRLVPIHSFEPNLYQKYFENVEIQNDGKWWII